MPIVPSMYVDASSSTFLHSFTCSAPRWRSACSHSSSDDACRSSPPALCAAALQNSVASPTSAICFATATCSRASASLLSRCLKSFTNVSYSRTNCAPVPGAVTNASSSTVSWCHSLRLYSSDICV